MITTTHQRPDDGQWFARDEGVDRYTGVPFVDWRPIYPDAPPVADQREWVEKKKDARYVPPPPPRQPAVALDPSHPAVPDKVRKALQTALSNGWAATLRRAESAAGLHVMVVEAKKPGRGVVLAWRFTDARDGVLRGQPHRYPAGWANDGAWLSRHHPVTHAEAMKELTR